MWNTFLLYPKCDFYRPPTKLGEGNVFTGVCPRGWVSVVPCPFLGWVWVCPEGVLTPPRTWVPRARHCHPTTHTHQTWDLWARVYGQQAGGTHPIGMLSCYFITSHNEVGAKVMFLLVSVILSTGGSASVHAGIQPPCPGDPSCQGDPPAKDTPCPGDPPCQGDPSAKETPLPRRPPAKETPPPAKETPPPCQGDPSPLPRRPPYQGDPSPFKETPLPRRPPTKETTLPRRPPPPGSRLRHTVNERPVRILLECILVFLLRFVDTAERREAETETDLDTDKLAHNPMGIGFGVCAL